MITSSANGKVKQVIQWQNKARERREAGIFLTEGIKLFQEAPEACVREVYLSENAAERLRKDAALWEKIQRTGYETVEEALFRKMSDTDTPQGILCVIRRPEYTLDRLLDGPAPLLVILENLQDPGNLGTILRTGEGAGITGVILGKETVDIYHPKTVRATMGSIFRVPFVCTDDLKKTVETVRNRGVKVYAAHLSGKDLYTGHSFRGGTAFLIGNEAKGLSAGMTALADGLLRIPMEGKVESLNAAVAAALLVYEAHRQRKASCG